MKNEKSEAKMTEGTLEINRELLSNLEFEVGETFDKGNFKIEDRKKLKEIENELHGMWKKYMEMKPE